MKISFTLYSHLARLGALFGSIAVVIGFLLFCRHMSWHSWELYARGAAILLLSLFFLLGWPKLVLDGQGIIIRNTLRTVFILWQDFERAEQYIGLLIYDKAGQKYRVNALAYAGKPENLKCAEPEIKLDENKKANLERIIKEVIWGKPKNYYLSMSSQEGHYLVQVMHKRYETYISKKRRDEGNDSISKWRPNYIFACGVLGILISFWI